MSIPSMPTLCRVYRPYTAPTLVASDVPCRLVPLTRLWGGPPYAGALPFMTHWADFLAGTDLRGGMRQTTTTSTSLTYLWDPDITDIIICCSAPPPYQIFIVLFVEERYIDTASHYRRAWLHWVQAVPGFTNPC